jgi:hypothetical protein
VKLTPHGQRETIFAQAVGRDERKKQYATKYMGEEAKNGGDEEGVTDNKWKVKEWKKR